MIVIFECLFRFQGSKHFTFKMEHLFLFWENSESKKKWKGDLISIAKFQA